MQTLVGAVLFTVGLCFSLKLAGRQEAVASQSIIDCDENERPRLVDRVAHKIVAI
jgi:hypothetical protein